VPAPGGMIPPTMAFDPAIHRRRSIRLRGFDYSSPGGYFVTVCTREQLPLFGEIIRSEMHLNEAGIMASHAWSELPLHYAHVSMDLFVVMPNHIHGIIVLLERGQARGPAPTKASLGLPDIVHRFKSLTSALYRQGANLGRWPKLHGPLWQRNYYERVIRSDAELATIRRYIRENPMRWEFDRENPAATNPEMEDPWI
jgi:putative transposase